MSSYIRSFSSDFNNKFDQYFLREQIQNSLIASTLLEITKTNDQIEITFENPLTGGDLTILDNLISIHDPTQFEKDKIPYNTLPVLSGNIKSDSLNTWRLVSIYDFRGTNNNADIKYIDIISRCTNSNSDYDIRMINRSSGDIISTISGLNNTEFQIIDLGNISNLPGNRSVLEIHIRINSNAGNVIVQNINIY